MRRQIILIIVAIVAGLAVTAGIAYAALSSPPTSLSLPTWTLTQLVVDGQEQPLSPAHPATLRILARDHQVAGSGGCNSYGGSYTLFGNQMRVGELRTTLIACADETIMTQESHFLAALPRVTSYRIDASTLILTGNGGKDRLTFQAR
jgi:heat shock protein HslJ